LIKVAQVCVNCRAFVVMVRNFSVFFNNINLLIGCTAVNCVKELGKHCGINETWNYGCRLWCFEG